MNSITADNAAPESDFTGSSDESLDYFGYPCARGAPRTQDYRYCWTGLDRHLLHPPTGPIQFKALREDESSLEELCTPRPGTWPFKGRLPNEILDQLYEFVDLGSVMRLPLVNKSTYASIARDRHPQLRQILYHGGGILRCLGITNSLKYSTVGQLFRTLLNGRCFNCNGHAPYVSLFDLGRICWPCLSTDLSNCAVPLWWACSKLGPMKAFTSSLPQVRSVVATRRNWHPWPDYRHKPLNRDVALVRLVDLGKLLLRLCRDPSAGPKLTTALLEVMEMFPGADEYAFATCTAAPIYEGSAHRLHRQARGILCRGCEITFHDSFDGWIGPERPLSEGEVLVARLFNTTFTPSEFEQHQRDCEGLDLLDLTFRASGYRFHNAIPDFEWREDEGRF